MSVNAHPHVEHDPLPGQLHRPRLEVLCRKRHQQDGEVEDREPVQLGGAPLRDVPVDRELDEIRLGQGRPAARDDGDEGDRDLAPVWTEYVSRPASSCVYFPMISSLDAL